MAAKISVCGYDCYDCKYYKKSKCTGCNNIQGEVWWTEYLTVKICPIYECVRQNKLMNCGECSKLPCDIWWELKDPEYSETEHKASIKTRIDTLKKA